MFVISIEEMLVRRVTGREILIHCSSHFRNGDGLAIRLSTDDDQAIDKTHESVYSPAKAFVGMLSGGFANGKVGPNFQALRRGFHAFSD